MTEYLAVDGSTIAYVVAGSGPLIVDALPSGLGRLSFLQPDAARA